MTGTDDLTDPTDRTGALTCDVAVVGAGPTGLLLACVLARLGVSAVVLDAKTGPTRESRALAVQARTLEVYDQVGVVDEVLERAWVADALAPGFGRRVLGRIALGAIGAGTTPYPALHVLEQSENERILHEHLQRLGGRVLWQHRLTALEDRPGGVLATAQGPGGALRVRARWCVGADGASSAVRRLRGIAFEGATVDRSFYVADAVGVRGLVAGAVNVRPGELDFLLTFPMGTSDGSGEASAHHRLLGAVRGVGDEAGTRAVLERVYGVTYEALTWFATYRVHHRVAQRFRDGAVFLAGDAAHVHSPVGGQGMNTGLQDAHGLALKLADVVAGVASDASLDRYEAERRPVALRLVRTTDRAFGAITSGSLLARLVRRGVVPLVVPVVARVVPRLPVGGRLFQYVSQTRIHYWMGDDARAAAGGRRGRVVGRRLPWTGSNHAALRSMRWQAHGYGALDEHLAAALRDELGLEVHVFDPAPGRGLVPGSVYLVRPDGFVAAAVPASPAAGAVADLVAALPDRWPAAAAGWAPSPPPPVAPDRPARPASTGCSTRVMRGR